MTTIARCAADIPAREIRWIWEPYLPRRMLSILDGDPGCGKSYLTLALASTLSTGAPFPGMDSRRARRPCRTLICNCEDPAEEVIVPRLQRLGADLTQVHVLSSEELHRFDDAGKGILYNAIKELQPRLFTIDTIVPYLPAGANTSSASDVRPTLRWLADLCKEFATSGLILRHLRKAVAQHAIYAGAGSMDFIGACRSGMIIRRDPEDESGYIFAHMKSNLSAKAASWRFGFDSAGAFEWRTRSEHAADDLMDHPAGDENEKRPQGRPRKLDGVSLWARENLKKNPLARAEFLNAARAEGISQRTLDRALRELGIRIDEDGYYRGRNFDA
jgi:DNA repair protein RadA/Sms